MGTSINSQSIASPIEEFLGYDQKGQSVILRRNTSHPGAPAKAPSFESPSEATLTKPIIGRLRFFGDFHEVKNILAKRAAG